MPLSLAERVGRFAAKHRLWMPGARVVAAVSGGSDSVALAFLLHELAERGDIVLAGIAHLHHHVRGTDADEDATFCRALAERLGVAAVIGDAQVIDEAREHGVSVEVAGRHARRRLYDEARTAMRAGLVAVAHTRDDQAETVLLRLVRGAGSGGLGAIAPLRDRIVRPLLDCSREDLQQYLRSRGETWREDVTNADRTIPRNRVRHAVMPELRAINAQADGAMSRAAELLRADDEFLERLANAAFLRCVGPVGDDHSVTIDRAEFAKLPVALARRVARYALETASPGHTYGLEEADALWVAAAGGVEVPVRISGVTMERFDGTVVLRRREPAPTPRTRSVGDVERWLAIPGNVELSVGGWGLEAAGPMPRPDQLDGGPMQVCVDASAVGESLIVRYRRPGDRLRPLGAVGSKKVQDVLVDRKVPRDDRDTVPIVTTEAGEIVWVAGHVLADPFRVTPLTKSVVVLTLRR